MPTDNPAGVPIVGPGTPYITPAMLIEAPTGISWSTIPGQNATKDEKLAAVLNICVRATSAVNGYCNQPLRATIDTEQFTGPGDFRCQNQPNGVTRLLSSRFPVASIVSGRVTPAAAFPASWQTIPANQFRPEKPLVGVYGSSAPSGSGTGGQAILLAPGWVSWGFGRLSSTVETTFINGWPHAALTQRAIAGTGVLQVDDITGWLGAGGNIYGGAGQEFVQVTAVTPTVLGAISGSGTLTLASPLTFTHDPGVLVSTLPGSVQQASIYFAVAQALTRGATATAVQSIGGSTTGGGPATTENYNKLAKDLIHTYRRTI